MFERFTERARRVIFFARLEASEFGSTTIESEHLLLGLLREDMNLVNLFFDDTSASDSIRKDIEARNSIQEKVSTSADLPLSLECKRILAYAAEETERLNHRLISGEHLLLGILREGGSVAAQILYERGLVLRAVREQLARRSMPDEPATSIPGIRGFLMFRVAGSVPNAAEAIKLAEAVWTQAYGPGPVASQQPAEAELKFNVWIVSGSAAPGSALFAFIRQSDGNILSVGRGRENL